MCFLCKTLLISGFNKKRQMDRLPIEAGLEVERKYVRSTYDSIAEEFSGTRYKKWPKVEAFLQGLPKNSLILDVGCGNGKYLDNESAFMIGCDISSQLLSICKDKGFEVLNCDMMKLPFRESRFDAIICIASLHHIVTAQRRLDCLREMIILLSELPTSRLLVQVWSYEQHLDKNNPYLKQIKASQNNETSERREVTIDGSLCIPIHKNRTPFIDQDLLVPFNIKKKTSEKASASTSHQEEAHEHLRYYHVFKENELEMLIEQVPEARIVDSYYDKGNWCLVISRVVN